MTGALGLFFFFFFSMLGLHFQRRAGVLCASPFGCSLAGGAGLCVEVPRRTLPRPLRACRVATLFFAEPGSEGEPGTSKGHSATCSPALWAGWEGWIISPSVQWRGRKGPLQEPQREQPCGRDPGSQPCGHQSFSSEVL